MHLIFMPVWFIMVDSSCQCLEINALSNVGYCCPCSSIDLTPLSRNFKGIFFECMCLLLWMAVDCSHICFCSWHASFSLSVFHFTCRFPLEMACFTFILMRLQRGEANAALASNSTSKKTEGWALIISTLVWNIVTFSLRLQRCRYFEGLYLFEIKSFTEVGKKYFTGLLMWAHNFSGFIEDEEEDKPKGNKTELNIQGN